MARIIQHKEALNEAAALLGAGGVVAIPTETVYGLAADALNGEAVAKIFETKGRPRFNPLIAHVANIGMAADLVALNDKALALAEKFWPGPLTMVLPMADGSPVHPLVTAGLDTLAIRVPKSDFTRALIAEFGRSLAAPSANRSGRISATTAAAVDAELGDRIELIVDGGSATVGVESTIVRIDGDRITLLRPGGIARGAIEDAVRTRLEAPSEGKVQAPGMLMSHYAPQLGMRLGVQEVEPGEALLAFGPQRAAGAEHAAAAINLSEAGDLREAAANLFSAMRELDRSEAAAIAVEPIPEQGLGEAINDRLRRAAAPRDMHGLRE
ncbi:MAG: threonylcarbamoyl-AMP synthase [Rhizobiaceae bacterium]|nr:threonylcarbamoyl-AMP synthase [Rhizobiaceae bacterium]